MAIPFSFLVILPFMLAFSYFFPRVFTVFYWVFMLTVNTMGTACLMYIIALFFGGLPFSLCCGISFFIFGLPITKAFAPKKVEE
ncbi:hypothetical protein EBZ80_23235 [bacterium]|nr:hypothetical protein [bacterium]